MAGSAVNLGGQLINLANIAGRPAELSDAQKGLFTNLSRALAPMPPVNPQDPQSLRAAAGEAMRRGDTASATQYANMAQQLERATALRARTGLEKRAEERLLQPIEPVAASRKNEFLAEQAKLEEQKKQGRAVAGAMAKFLDPDLAVAVSAGGMSVEKAVSVMKERKLEKGRNERSKADRDAAKEAREFDRDTRITIEKMKQGRGENDPLGLIPTPTQTDMLIESAIEVDKDAFRGLSDGNKTLVAARLLSLRRANPEIPLEEHIRTIAAEFADRGRANVVQDILRWLDKPAPEGTVAETPTAASHPSGADAATVKTLEGNGLVWNGKGWVPK